MVGNHPIEREKLGLWNPNPTQTYLAHMLVHTIYHPTKNQGFISNTQDIGHTIYSEIVYSWAL